MGGGGGGGDISMLLLDCDYFACRAEIAMAQWLTLFWLGYLMDVKWLWGGGNYPPPPPHHHHHHHHHLKI